MLVSKKNSEWIITNYNIINRLYCEPFSYHILMTQLCWAEFSKVSWKDVFGRMTPPPPCCLYATVTQVLFTDNKLHYNNISSKTGHYKNSLYSILCPVNKLAKYNNRKACEKIILKYITTITIVTLNEMKFSAWEPLQKALKSFVIQIIKTKLQKHFRGITEIYEHMLEDWTCPQTIMW